MHDGNASGAPWVRFGAVHALYAGTKDTRSGVAPFGLGYAYRTIGQLPLPALSQQMEFTPSREMLRMLSGSGA